MQKIKDRFTLGIVAGLLGFGAKMLVDEISLRQKLSKRSYRETASGIWVNSHKEATSLKGNILGLIMDAGLSTTGAIIKLNVLSKYGRDHLLLKGTYFGAAFGAIVTAAIGSLSNNKVRPKDAASNLSHILSNIAYGLITTIVLAKLGDDSLFDSKPVNDSVNPTLKTTEQVRIENIQHENQMQHDSFNLH